MTVARLARSVLPRPRRPVTWRTALPLALFLAGFAGACLALELADVLLFTAPRAFLLSAFLPWVWWMHVAGASGLRGARSVAALLVRLCLAGLFIVLLAEPRAVRKDDALSVVYAVDVSDSIGESAADAAFSYVTRTVSEKPETDEAGLVVFGRDAAVELPPRMSFPFEAVNSRVLRDGTNLAKALFLAAAVLPEEHQGRVVLISDGMQTEGALPEVLDELNSRGIAVDVLPVRYDYDEEVWLERLDLPRFVRAGETYEASVVLSSLRDGTGTLRLLENGEPVYEGRVEFSAGKNRFVLPIYMRGPGYYQYVAVIDVPEGHDGWAENNRAVSYLYLRGAGKVLVVIDPNGDARDWQTLARALSDGGFQVETQSSYALPSDPMSLLPYDCVIFANVPSDAFDVMQLEAVRAAVYNQGVGFLMVGGPNSFGPGGYHRTAIEKALPVTMDITQKKVLPKGALVIVLHTCEFPQGNTWGKRIAKEAVRVLGAQDEVGVLAYQGGRGASWIFKLTPASEYEELVQLINQADLGDMPSFATTMQMGLAALKASDAAAKHMIIISDGDPSPPMPALLKEFKAAGVSVSTVVVAPHQDRDALIMKQIAGATGGRFYFPANPAQLPSIFIKEAKTLRRNLIQNVTFTPEVLLPSPILKGLEAIPRLHGYVLTTPKPRALSILKGPGAEQVFPVLATWRYGVGKTAAWTSDLSPNWAAEWTGWERYRPFVNQLVRDVARTQRQGYLQARVIAEGGEATLLVDDSSPKGSFLDLEAVVQGPQQRSETVRLRQVGPQRYEGRFPLWGKGHYQVVGAGVGDGRSERFVTGHVVAYSPEYLRFRSDLISLKAIAAQTGGRILSGEETGRDVFTQARVPKASSRPIADLFLVMLALLVPLDVAVRRVQLDWALIRGWIGFGRERQPAGETFEALLRRKEAINLLTADDAGRRQERRPAAKPGGQETEAPPPDGQAGGRPEPPAAGEEPSTLKRLLARKEKWKEE